MPLFAITVSQLKTGGRFLLREAGYALPSLLDSLTGDFEDRPSTSGPQWRRWVTTASRVTPTSTVEDRAQFKVDLLNVTAGDIDTTWTSGDYAAVKALFDTFLTTLQPLSSPAVTFDGYKAYAMQFNPVGDLTRPFIDLGAPRYQVAISKTGTGAAGQAYQVATSVTLKTGLAKHWGRFYLPNPYSSALNTGAGGYRWTSAYQTSVANATRTLFNGLIDAGFWPVVPVGQSNKAPFHALLGVGTVQVDDIPDVIRRRRPRQAALRITA